MKCYNKFIAMILSITMVLTMVPFISSKTEVKAASFSITTPTQNKLAAAGDIDIDWTDATGGTVKEYSVYINNQKVDTTTESEYEWYSTTVQMNIVYVVAEYTNGKTEQSDSINFGVSKKGLGLATDMGANLDLSAMGVAWYYNWGEKPSSGSQYQGIEYVPMVWKETNANNLKNRVNSAINKGYKYILTYNEPDLAGQCNMSVNDVYNAWQGLDDVDGIKISSPVTALWPKASTNWFQTFMEKIDVDNDYDPDFISIHCYPDNYAGAGMATWFLEEVVDWTWNKYHKPIWITEFSTTGSSVTATGGNGTKEFWEAVMPGLDEREYVERYAAFGFNSDTTGLWKYATGDLTPGGEVYRDLGNPDGYTPEETPEPDYKTSISKAATEVFGENILINNVVCTDYISQDGVSVTASSETGGNKAAYAIDDNIGSRWESTQGNDAEYIIVDLGQIRNIKQINIAWEGASAAKYTIDVSTDGNNFTTIATVESTNGGRVDATTLKEMTSARYIKINGISRTTQYGYSIYDMAVYGTDDTKVDETTPKPTTTPRPTTTPKPTTTKKPTTQATTTKASTDSNVTTNSQSGSETSGADIVGTSANKIEKPARVTIKKATKKRYSKKASIKIKKAKGAKGYQIRWCKNKKFKKYKQKNTKKLSYTIKGLSRNKKYYVKVRAYNYSLAGKKQYGKWSKIKTIKMK